MSGNQRTVEKQADERGAGNGASRAEWPTCEQESFILFVSRNVSELYKPEEFVWNEASAIGRWRAKRPAEKT